MSPREADQGVRVNSCISDRSSEESRERIERSGHGSRFRKCVLDSLHRNRLNVKRDPEEERPRAQELVRDVSARGVREYAEPGQATGSTRRHPR